jgi:arylsulfatase A-like enzyme
VVTDDQRVGSFSTMPETRNYFHRRSTSFSEAYDTTPLCCPARASIFTGQYVHNHGVRTTSEPESLNQDHTLQHYLRDGGYLTGVVGKYLNHWDMSDPPHFDRWAIFTGDPGPDGYYDEYWNFDGKRRIARRYTTNIIGDKSLEFLRDFERQDDQPWLLYVFPYAPHPPFTAHPKYADAPVKRWKGNPGVDEKNRSDKPPWVRSKSAKPSDGRKVRKGQLRTLMSVDDMVGDTFKELNKLGEARDTLAFYLSDNGYLWGEHGLLGKRHPYLESVKTSMFMRWPNRVSERAKDDRLVSNVDLAPTVLDAAAIQPEHVLDGRSLFSSHRRERLLLEYWVDEGVAEGVPEWASTLTPEAQYTEYYEGSQTIFTELYDRVEDPWQLRNVLEDKSSANDPSPQELEALSEQLEADKNCTGATCP